jgi:hypothetical protein
LLELRWKTLVLLCLVFWMAMFMVQEAIGSASGTPTPDATATLDSPPSIELQFPDRLPTQELKLESYNPVPNKYVSPPLPTPARIKMSLIIIVVMWLILAIGLVYFIYRQVRTIPDKEKNDE